MFQWDTGDRHRQGRGGRCRRHGCRPGDPVGEHIAEFQDDGELLVVNGGWGVFGGTQVEAQGVCDAVPRGRCGLGEVGVEELNGVRVTQCFGRPLHHIQAVVVAEGRANVEALAVAEVPRRVAARRVVDDDGTAHWAKRYVVEVEGAIEVFPRGYLGGKGQLTHEVQRDLCLR